MSLSVGDKLHTFRGEHTVRTIGGGFARIFEVPDHELDGGVQAKLKVSLAELEREGGAWVEGVSDRRFKAWLQPTQGQRARKAHDARRAKLEAEIKERQERRERERQERAERLAREGDPLERLQELLDKLRREHEAAVIAWPGSAFLAQREEDMRLMGLGEAFTRGEFRARWRALALEHHPDRGGDEGTFAQLVQARDRLGEWLDARERVAGGAA